MGTYKYVKKWRKKVSDLLHKSFDDKCGICGYNKCRAALEFHHLDESQKEGNISSYLNISSFSKMAKEAEKCVLLCANCHREFHSGLINIPDEIKRFDKNMYFSLLSEEKTKNKKEKKIIGRKRVNWENIDVLHLRDVKHETWKRIAEIADVTDSAVIKRYKKLKHLDAES